MEQIRRREFVAITAGAMMGGSASSQAATEGSTTATDKQGSANMGIQRIGITQPTGGTPIISFATIHAGLVHTCGVSADPNKPGDVKNQTRQVLERIDLLLAGAGTNKSRLLAAQVWLTDMSLFAAHNEAWNEWVDPKNPPARACLQSPSLWRPGLLVEIMATAAL
jgi:enamine deaminase RidA (YjgF/YER057c/UK114 family)